MIASMASRWFNAYRRTAMIVDPVIVSSSVAVSRAMAGPSFIQVKVSGGTTGSGVVTIAGTGASGAAQSEILTFTKNGAMVTVAQFASVTTITTTGLADETEKATIEARAVSADGTPRLVESLVAELRPGVMGAPTQSGWPARTQGTSEDGAVTLALDFEEAWTPRPGDIITEPRKGYRWTVQSVDEQTSIGAFTPTTWLLKASRHDQ